ncbi:MAG: hypothetical protein J0L83_11160 [Chitinophagales bacterium]|jgi:DNA/RNA endonuclease YhcR with UshA esterase domain|nr:hypothetical protein [Chitinophagales bacterium]
MRKLLLFVFVCFLGLAAKAQETISIDDIAKYVGKEVKVCDKVYSARFLDNSARQLTLINLGGKYPNQKMTVVIDGDSRKNFTWKPEEFLLNKEICVKGKVKEYKGGYQIDVTKPEDLEVKSGQ